MARLLPCWHANLKNWHTLERWHAKLKNQHVFGTLAHWHVKMRSWHAFGTLTRRPRGQVWTHVTRFGKPIWNMAYEFSMILSFSSILLYSTAKRIRTISLVLAEILCVLTTLTSSFTSDWEKSRTFFSVAWIRQKLIVFCNNWYLAWLTFAKWRSGFTIYIYRGFTIEIIKWTLV